MKSFRITKHSSLSQKNIFEISTDIKNFQKIMPKYFKSIDILETSETKIIAIEKIKFLGINLKVKTKHVIIKPNMHEVHILDGPTKGTRFIETYVPTKNGCEVIIEVKLVLNGWLRVFRFLEGQIAKKMANVTNEFISLSEKFQSLKPRS